MLHYFIQQINHEWKYIENQIKNYLTTTILDF